MSDTDGLDSLSEGYNRSIVFPDIEGETITVPPAQEGDPYAGVAYANFGDQEGSVIVGSPLGSEIGPYHGVLNPGKYTFSDEEAETITANPPNLSGLLYGGTVTKQYSNGSDLPYGGTITDQYETESDMPYGGLIANRLSNRSDLPYGGLLSTPTVKPLASLPQLGISRYFVRPPVRRGDISGELSDAWDMAKITGDYPDLSEAQLQVLSWLRTYRPIMILAEQKWQIDRRAIAGAIAWEALENPRHLTLEGPGKVHPFSSVVRQIESLGYMPQISTLTRIATLRTPEGAIDYIGAIMRGVSDVAAQFNKNIRCDAPILTNEYQSHDLSEWQGHLRDRQAQEGGAVGALEPGNPMGIWVGNNMRYLELAVGTPAQGVCSSQ